MAPAPSSVAAWMGLAALSLGGCVPRPQMCLSEPECGAQGSCVAGRCVGHGAVAAISTARRVLVDPVDAAFIRRGDGPAPRVARIGGDGGGVLLLRFAVDLPPEATVLEAYLILVRPADADVEPPVVALRAARIVEPWDSASVTWARQPRLVDPGTPLTRARSTSGPLVRVDVRDVVLAWRRRARDDFGLAIVADGKGSVGLAFALDPRIASQADRGELALEVPASGPFSGPTLELYVK